MCGCTDDLSLLQIQSIPHLTGTCMTLISEAAKFMYWWPLDFSLLQIIFHTPFDRHIICIHTHTHQHSHQCCHWKVDKNLQLQRFQLLNPLKYANKNHISWPTCCRNSIITIQIKAQTLIVWRPAPFRSPIYLLPKTTNWVLACSSLATKLLHIKTARK